MRFVQRHRLTRGGLSQADSDVGYRSFKLFIRANAHHIAEHGHAHHDMFALSTWDSNRASVLSRYGCLNIRRQLGVDTYHI